MLRFALLLFFSDVRSEFERLALLFASCLEVWRRNPAKVQARGAATRVRRLLPLLLLLGEETEVGERCVARGCFPFGEAVFVVVESSALPTSGEEIGSVEVSGY